MGRPLDAPACPAASVSLMDNFVTDDTTVKGLLCVQYFWIDV